MSTIVKKKCALLVIDSGQAGPRGRWSREREHWKKVLPPEWCSVFLLRASQEVPSPVESTHGNVNTLTVPGKDSFRPGILNKTLAGLRHLDEKFEFIVRTNLSTRCNFPRLHQKLELLGPRSYSGVIGTHRCIAAYVSGTCITLGPVAQRALLDADPHPERGTIPDDIIIAKILSASSISPSQPGRNWRRDAEGQIPDLELFHRACFWRLKNAGRHADKLWTIPLRENPN